MMDEQLTVGEAWRLADCLMHAKKHHEELPLRILLDATCWVNGGRARMSDPLITRKQMY